jgi:hypothetical protein
VALAVDPREFSFVPRAGYLSSGHRCYAPWVLSVPRALFKTLSKAALCREPRVSLSAQIRALGRGSVSGSVYGETS